MRYGGQRRSSRSGRPSVESRLLALLGQVEDEELRREIEEDLKKLSEPTQ